MKARCPYCDYEYDNIELSDIGCKANCASCEKEFIVHEYPSSEAPQEAETSEAPQPLLSLEEIEHLRLEREVNKNDERPEVTHHKKMSLHSETPAARSSSAPSGVAETVSPARTLNNRYSDAYIAIGALVKVGQVTSGVGRFIICIGVALGIWAACKFFGSDKTGMDSLLIGGMMVLIGGIALYIWGILIATVSQVFQAIVDIAINSSPLITVEEKASILS